MLVISFFLTNVEMKQFGVAALFMNFKEIILHLVHLFARLVIPPPSVTNCHAYARRNTCELDNNWVHIVIRWWKVIQYKCLNKLNP
jgi:hypothetical protein